MVEEANVSGQPVTHPEEDEEEAGVRGIGARRAAEALWIALRLAGEGLEVHPTDVAQLAAAGAARRSRHLPRPAAV
jgi:hypothetical protein